MYAEFSEASQYGNDAPGAPSLQAELAKLREENSVLKRSTRGVCSVVFFCAIFHVILHFCRFCVMYYLIWNKYLICCDNNNITIYKALWFD